MDRPGEFSVNLQTIRDFLHSAGLGCVLLSDHSNVSWLAGGGRGYVSWSVDQGAARVLITPTDVLFLTSNNEAKRLEAEEFAGLPWKVISYPWWDGPAGLLTELLASNGPAGVDSRIPWAPDALVVGAEVARLRVRLNEPAQERARSLGGIVGETMAAVCQQLKKGESEFEIAGRMVGALVTRGLDVPTCLVAVDDRVFEWRHFLPTNRRLERYAALSVCARKDGLVLSCTRLVHFGPLPEDLRHRVEAVCRVDAELIAATKPGATSGQLFEVARRAYAEVGFPDEWRNHHQGGLAGYRGREWFATPGGNEQLVAGQIVAWNPTVPGAKVEDTILVGPDGNEIITESDDYPFLEVLTERGFIRRPAILVR